MQVDRLARGALGCAIALTLVPFDANALVIARVTRHGYIMVDEPGAATPYAGEVPIGTGPNFQFIANVTHVIADYPDAPHGQYLAVMQTVFSTGPGRGLAYYEGLSNDVRGIGFTSPLGGGRETFDLNPTVGSAFPITGFVWLNSIGLYDTAAGEDVGQFIICPQEFGHRFGTKIKIPPYPAEIIVDAGTDAGSLADGAADTSTVDSNTDDATVDGASLEDATTDDASLDDVASTPDVAAPDVLLSDASAADAAMFPALAVDALLGRQRAHWSYFVSSGGSPMEGNTWQDIGGGSFRTATPSGRFSPLDLYLMGVASPAEVPPFFVIAEPNVNGQRDDTGAVINRESPPDRGRPTTIRGRRVNYTIDDVIRANGRRSPAYIPGASPDGGSAQPDLPVMWVLLARPAEVTARLADQFDTAIETCGTGYRNAANNRSRLIAISAPMPPDAGFPDAGFPDTGRADVVTDLGADASRPQDAALADAGIACLIRKTHDRICVRNV